MFMYMWRWGRGNHCAESAGACGGKRPLTPGAGAAGDCELWTCVLRPKQALFKSSLHSY